MKNLLSIAISIILFSSCQKEEVIKNVIIDGHSCCEEAVGYVASVFCYNDQRYVIEIVDNNSAKLLEPLKWPDDLKQVGKIVRFEYKLLGITDTCKSAGCYGDGPWGVNTNIIEKIRLCSIVEDTINVVMPMKPAIYLYPVDTVQAFVGLDYIGKLTFTYPDYNNAIGGWNVIASPDGHLTNLDDGREYQYLFWEGKQIKDPAYNIETGFVIKGYETKDFLQNILPELGLIPKEYNEMIVFWLPQMQNNRYNLIHFAGKSYTETAPLKIIPEPDNIIRVFMVFIPLENEINVNKQVFPVVNRNGFTVVEWGGAILSPDCLMPQQSEILANKDLKVASSQQ